MERMWRKVNHSFGGRASKMTASTINNATIQSTDTVSSAGGFGDGQIVVAVATNMPSSTATGRRLASSGGQISSKSSHMMQKSLSQHVLHQSTASSERRRRRRRKSRARRSGGGVTSCVSGGGDNMSSSGGFYTIKETAIQGSNHRHNRQSQNSSRMMLMASSAPSGTVMMYPNYHSQVNNSRELTLGAGSTSLEPVQAATSTTAVPTTSTDISLRQRAVAKLRMFNFHLNWDLHMTHCKPCGPRIGSGGGNIITRRLCRNRRREDNELYRSNSFKFERFERKECIEELTNTLQKQIAICDDYSLPVDFVKKRPSSFDPCLADAIPTNPENWTAPSPQAEFNVFTESQQQHQQSTSAVPPPLPPPPLSTLPIAANTSLNQPIISNAPNHTLPNNSQQRYSQSLSQTNNVQLKSNSQHSHQTVQRPAHPPLPNTIKQACVKLIEGYSDPKDSKRHKKVYHKKGKRRVTNKNPKQASRSLKQNDKPQSNTNNRQLNSTIRGSSNQDKRNTYSSDSSAPKSSDDEDNHSLKIPELNSPDSISDDLIRPLPAQLHRSPRKLTVAANAEHSKRNPSPYYYSDLLKSKDVADAATDKEVKNKSRQSTASEPPQLTQPHIGSLNVYRKSSSLDAPEREDQNPIEVAKEVQEFEEDLTSINLPSNRVLASKDTDLKRYSFTEEGVHIIRCESPSTSTSDESDCSECLKRREWHARALALVRKTCNVQPLNTGSNGELGQAAAEENLKCTSEATAAAAVTVDSQLLSMPPHRLLGPAVCACVAPPSTIGDDLDEYFRPRSVFYVHPNGIHECADCCSPDAKNLTAAPSRSLLDKSGSRAQSNDALIKDAILDEAEGDEMSGRMRQIYETAFDCKVAKSDDDLDEVDRITNHSVMLQMNNGNSFSPKTTESRTTKSTSQIKSRLEGKRLKNSKNQAIQEQASNSGGNASSSGSPLTVGGNGVRAVRSTEDTESPLNISASALSTDLANVHICEPPVDQQNNASISTSQLPMRGYTPSPPSTAPLPIKFPGKHDRFFMNSIKSAPNLPSSNPAHPRLRDLRLPIQSSLRQQQLQQQPGSSLGTSNENSLTDSAYVNPPSSDAPHKRHTPKMGVSKHRDRPRSFVLESGRVLELRKGHAVHHHHVGNGGRRQHNYSSTESIATSSSGGSMESLRSSTSEGNRSTSSSESRHSTSLSSHSSESGSSSVAFPLRPPVVIHSKLHILSPISDKSSQEPASELSEQNKTQNPSPEEITHLQQQPLPSNQKLLQQQVGQNVSEATQLQLDALKKRRAVPQNKTLLHLTDEILGSDSGISLHSREDGKATSGIQKFTLPKLNFPLSDKGPDSGLSAAGCVSNSTGLPQDLRDLPFDMPKLRRRKTLQQDACTSGSATSVDLGDLPFDMPKLRRRLRANQTEINNLMVHSTESSGISQASSSHSMRDDNKTAIKLDSAIFRQNLTLNLNEPRQTNKFGSLDLRGVSSNKELNLNLPQGHGTAVDMIDISIPLDRQGWYHGAITRIDAESTLRPLDEGSFLVRNCESTKQDYSLSLKGAKGFMHMRIQRNENGQYILGQFSRPFETVPDMIRHFCLNRLPVRGAEHMCLIEPVIAQLL